MIRLLVIFFSICIISCNASDKKNSINSISQTENTVDERIEALKKAFEKKEYSTFFELFPNSFIELSNFYGFDDRLGKKPLYDFYEDHINYFYEFEGKVTEDNFMQKAFGIAQNGLWDADAIGLFQSKLSKRVIDSPKSLIKILADKPNGEVESFWHFIFDGSSKNDLQNKEKFETIYNKINTLDKKQGKILKGEFEKMYK